MGSLSPSGVYTLGHPVYFPRNIRQHNKKVAANMTENQRAANRNDKLLKMSPKMYCVKKRTNKIESMAILINDGNYVEPKWKKIKRQSRCVYNPFWVMPDFFFFFLYFPTGIGQMERTL